MSGMILDIDLEDCDVFFNITREASKEDGAEVMVTRVEFRGIDITRGFNTRELSSIQLNVESELDDRFIARGRNR